MYCTFAGPIKGQFVHHSSIAAKAFHVKDLSKALIQKKPKGVTERSVVVSDSDVTPFKVECELFHIAIHCAMNLVSIVVFDPAFSRRSHVADGDNDQLAVVTKNPCDLGSSGFEVSDIHEAEVAEDDIKRSICKWQRFS